MASEEISENAFIFARFGRRCVQSEPRASRRHLRSFGVLTFWPINSLATRIFHTIGTLAGWSLLAIAIILHRPWLILMAIVVPYAVAWFSHFFVEHNRPATFGHPIWSWLADQKMVAMVLAGKMGEEVKRCAQNRSSVATI